MKKYKQNTEMLENVNHEKKENSQQQNVSGGVGNSNTLKITPTASVDTIQDVKIRKSRIILNS